MTDSYSPNEQAILLHIARHTLEVVTSGGQRPALDESQLPESLMQPRACFVTFTEGGMLRGCTGTLVARQPLAEEVSQTTVHTAFNDPRFDPVRSEEVPWIVIEISVLTPPQPLVVTCADELLHALRPGNDGVVLKVGGRRSTFLPQVWEHYPDPVDFLSALCRKANLPSDAWQLPEAEIDIYQSVMFEEPHRSPHP